MSTPSSAPDSKAFKRLSKFCSYVLRHAAPSFGLEPDAEGFVPLADLAAIVASTKRHAWADAAQLRELVRTSDKQRYELRPARPGDAGDFIRARYGHSFLDVEYEPCRPPDKLYHGTGTSALGAILENGLMPMSRRFVHLTDDLEMARLVGMRHPGTLAILTIDAARAHADGLVFHNPGPAVYLSGPIPAAYIATDEPTP